jgi:hypothetical protein
MQRARCLDASSHLYTYVYKFFAPVTGYHYIVRAEYHEGDVSQLNSFAKRIGKVSTNIQKS